MLFFTDVERLALQYEKLGPALLENVVSRGLRNWLASAYAAPLDNFHEHVGVLHDPENRRRCYKDYGPATIRQATAVHLRTQGGIRPSQPARSPNLPVHVNSGPGDGEPIILNNAKGGGDFS